MHLLGALVALLLAEQAAALFNIPRQLLQNDAGGEQTFLPLPQALKKRVTRSKAKPARAPAHRGHGAVKPARSHHRAASAGKHKGGYEHHDEHHGSREGSVKSLEPPAIVVNFAALDGLKPRMGLQPATVVTSRHGLGPATTAPATSSRHGLQPGTVATKTSTVTTAVAPITPPPTPTPTTAPVCPQIKNGVNLRIATPGELSLATIADGPAPTLSAVPCQPTPTSFAGTSQGFAALNAGVRYCDPPPAAEIRWAGPDGDVTQDEIESLLGALQQTGTHYNNGNDGNILSDGTIGLATYAAGQLFEITGDRRALDVAVRIADNILATRNDPNTGRVMWDGIREPIWPTKPEDGLTATYYGCENMHTVGHMVNVALYILKNPAIWNLIPQATSAPTPFGASTTYLQRAQAYVAAGDLTFRQAFLPYFFNSKGLLIQPNDQRWKATGDLPPGSWMPWNRRMMVLHGLIRLATAHTLSPTQNQGYAAQYNNLIDANIADFVSALQPISSRGYPTYTWNYSRNPPGGSIEFNNGIHSAYDIWGAWIAWQHGSPALTSTVMQNLANTMQYQIYDPSTRGFSAYVNGQSNPCVARENQRRNIWGWWAYYGDFIPQWYYSVAIADANSLDYTWNAAALLWAKSARFQGSSAFWQGYYSS